MVDKHGKLYLNSLKRTNYIANECSRWNYDNNWISICCNFYKPLNFVIPFDFDWTSQFFSSTVLFFLHNLKIDVQEKGIECRNLFLVSRKWWLFCQPGHANWRKIWGKCQENENYRTKRNFPTKYWLEDSLYDNLQLWHEL